MLEATDASFDTLAFLSAGSDDSGGSRQSMLLRWSEQGRNEEEENKTPKQGGLERKEKTL